MPVDEQLTNENNDNNIDENTDHEEIIGLGWVEQLANQVTETINQGFQNLQSQISQIQSPNLSETLMPLFQNLETNLKELVGKGEQTKPPVKEDLNEGGQREVATVQKKTLPLVYRKVRHANKDQ